jgi:uncharacterized repeat protein (TIGR01451 family)
MNKRTIWSWLSFAMALVFLFSALRGPVTAQTPPPSSAAANPDQPKWAAIPGALPTGEAGILSDWAQLAVQNSTTQGAVLATDVIMTDALPDGVSDRGSSLNALGSVTLGDFESGDLTGWVAGGAGPVEVLQAADFAPGIAPPQGDFFALLSSGPGAQGGIVGDLDGNGVDDFDAPTLSVNFDLAPAEVPVILSFDWAFLTEEVSFHIGSADDFFDVRLNGVPILTGSTPGVAGSTYPDTPGLDAVPYAVVSGGPTDGSSFVDGYTGFQPFATVIAASGAYTLQFQVADTYDQEGDSGLLVDNVALLYYPDLVITKTASADPVYVGSLLTYTLVVTNLGTLTATDVIETDNLPAGVTFVSATPSSGICTESGGVVTCQSNLVSNPGAETGDLSGWTIIDNGGYGWSTTGDYPHQGSHSFITSYSWDTRYQEIDLLAAGFSESYLDSAPPVLVGEWFRGFDCGGGCNPADYYYLKVELHNAAHDPIAAWNVGTQGSPAVATANWEEQAHVFSGYGAGLRYLYFEDGGDDEEHWLGYYGTQMDDAYAVIAPIALAPGEVFTATLVTQVDAGGVLTNTAQVTLHEPDFNPTDNTVTITVHLYAVYLPIIMHGFGY